MKLLQGLHVALTLLLLGIVGVGVVCMLTGVLKVHDPTKTGATGPRSPGGSEPRPRLLVIRGQKPGMEYALSEGQNYIGRADQKPVDIDLEIQESPDRIWSSRQHAVITVEAGKLSVEDLNSSNGTYLNREKLVPGKKHPLQNGDIVQIGEVQMKVEF